MTRRAVFLLAVSFVIVVAVLLFVRVRDVGALSAIEEQGPSSEVFAVLAAFEADEAVVGEALSGLLDALSSGDTPLLDRRPQYDWVDAYRTEPLREADLELLQGTVVAPGDDEALARAGGVFSAVTVGCSFEALASERSEDGVSTDEASFAGQEFLRKQWVQSRRVTVDLGGATSDVLLRLTAQVGEASSGMFTVAQAWELEVLVDRDDGTTARLLATWMEVSSPEYGAGNRLWSGWVLHRAFEDASAWTAACGGGVSDEEVDGAGRAVGASVQAAPLCQGVRMVPIAPHARELEELVRRQDLAFGDLDAEIDNQTADLLVSQGLPEDSAVVRRARQGRLEDPVGTWQRDGERRWAEVFGTPLSAMSLREKQMMRRLVDRFGNTPDLLPRAVKVRIRARWLSGALAEFLETDDVRIPVCPGDIAFAAHKLGWESAAAREAHKEDLDLVVASMLLESGSVRAPHESQWEALREVFAFGEALHRLFSSPAPDWMGDPDGGDEEIDRVDSNL